jgi:hypothetical protein
VLAIILPFILIYYFVVGRAYWFAHRGIDAVVIIVVISAAYYAAHRVAARYSPQGTTARRAYPQGTLPQGQARTITGLVISLLMAIIIVKATSFYRAIRVDLDIGILFVVVLLVFVVPRFLRK